MTNEAKPKYLEPELYFIQKQITIGDPDSGEQVTGTQLVKKGQLWMFAPYVLLIGITLIAFC